MIVKYSFSQKFLHVFVNKFWEYFVFAQFCAKMKIFRKTKIRESFLIFALFSLFAK